MPDPIELEVDSPHGRRTIMAPNDPRATIADTLRHEALPLNTRCGQRGLCDGCVVELVRGRVMHRNTGSVVEADGQPVEVHGCEHRLDSAAAAIRIPARSLLAHEPQVVTTFRLNVSRSHDPLWQPETEAGGATPGGACDPAARRLGVAIDIGTTTVALLLLDMNSGEVVGQASGFNRQMHLGDDVLTRINLCSTDPSMLRTLQQAVVEQTIVPLLREALRPAEAAGVIVCLAVAGNTTMQHLLAGVDPSSMGFAPFTPAFVEHRVVSCRDIGLKIPRHAGAAAAAGAADPPVHLLPSAAAYVGADLCAGVLASGLLYDEGPSILIDVGTNGEIILKHGNQLLGCATAAGPAFEGAKLASGIRAGHGAVETICFDTDPFAIHTGVIGRAKPIGICGSAYVDFLADARRIGLITATGRFDLDAFPPGPDTHLHTTEHGPELEVARGQGGRHVVITEPDIASLLQAKAAIGAGVLTLLERVGMAPRDVKRVYLAGGFGMHINVPNAIAAGLLPGFEPDQVQVVGNTSLAGAFLALLDRQALSVISDIGKRIEIIELNLDPGFEGRYIDQLSLQP